MKKSNRIKVGPRDALVIVDLQNDFCPGGSLAVTGGDLIVQVINQLALQFSFVAATKDWHPANHSSFKEFGGNWPPHCVWDTEGANFHPAFNREAIERIFYKGFLVKKDEYSGFGGVTPKGDHGDYRFSPEQLRHMSIHDAYLSLEQFLRTNRVRRIFVVGLATDYCVKATVLDARKLGFQVCVITDAIAAVNVNSDDGEKALQEMVAAGAVLCTSADILNEEECGCEDRECDKCH